MAARPVCCAPSGAYVCNKSLHEAVWHSRLALALQLPMADGHACPAWWCVPLWHHHQRHGQRPRPMRLPGARSSHMQRVHRYVCSVCRYLHCPSCIADLHVSMCVCVHGV